MSLFVYASMFGLISVVPLHQLHAIFKLKDGLDGFPHLIATLIRELNFVQVFSRFHEVNEKISPVVGLYNRQLEMVLSGHVCTRMKP